MWRNNYVHRVRLNHSKKSLRYVFGRADENDLIYLVVHNRVFNNSQKINNTRKILIKVSGYDFI